MRQDPRTFRTLMATATALALTACTPALRSYRAPEAGPYLDLRDKTTLVLPMDVHMPTDALALGAALLGGFMLEAGPSAIALQPIKPALDSIGLGNLSAGMAHALVHAAFVHNGPVFDTCSGEDFSRLPEDAEKVAQKAGDLLGRADLTPAFLIVLHLDYIGPGSVPRTNHYRVNGGAYDVAHKSVAVAFEWEQTTAEDSMMAEMAALGKRILNTLQGELPPGSRSAAKAAPAPAPAAASATPPAATDGHTDH
jgi:hypothetical protein